MKLCVSHGRFKLQFFVQVTASGSSSSVVRNKEQFRSHSLPLGAQLNADWLVSVGAPSTASAAAPTQVLLAPLDSTPVRHTPRVSAFSLSYSCTNVITSYIA